VVVYAQKKSHTRVLVERGNNFPKIGAIGRTDDLINVARRLLVLRRNHEPENLGTVAQLNCSNCTKTTEALFRYPSLDSIASTLTADTYNSLTIMNTKITEIGNKAACAVWCPLRQYPGLMALGSKVRTVGSFFELTLGLKSIDSSPLQ
jgi:hypothetical protein